MFSHAYFILLIVLSFLEQKFPLLHQPPLQAAQRNLQVSYADWS